MKLSDLEKYVAALKASAAKSQTNKDPNVRFYATRGVVGQPIVGQSEIFVIFEIDSDPAPSDNKIIAKGSNIIGTIGDFEIPLNVVPFYK